MGFHTVEGCGTRRSVAEALGSGEVGLVPVPVGAGRGDAEGTLLPVHPDASTARVRRATLPSA